MMSLELWCRGRLLCNVYKQTHTRAHVWLCVYVCICVDMYVYAYMHVIYVYAYVYAMYIIFACVRI